MDYKIKFTCACGNEWSSDGEGDEYQQGLKCPKCGGDDISSDDGK